MDEAQQRPVCDYEGSDYRTRFWDGKGRDYEDLVERIALRRLLPPRGNTLIDIGAGFGRLADEYTGYDRVVLFDYSRTLLREAKERLGHDPRFHFVAGNWYQMPFADAAFEVMVQVRTIHHAADVPALLEELSRVSASGGTYVLEFANKRNLKAILRYALRRQDWSPFTTDPVEFVELNYDFHPSWMCQQLQQAGFQPRQMRTVSHFRLALIKRLVPPAWLATLDRLLQPSGSWIQLTPSVFVASRHPQKAKEALTGEFFACPSCGSALPSTQESKALLTCDGCGRIWKLEEGIYDFKASQS
jgi:ubiquinone/menaquinone biosynthesis C-methylase UbiE